jgi:hypothetical protein
MKFIIKDSVKSEKQQLIYIEEECSFYMDGVLDHIDMELILNKISLAVFENKIINVGGFCGLDKSMKSNYQVPVFNKGILKVEHSLKYGLAYSINDDLDYEYPVYVNTQTGWVCIGYPEKSGKAVEFLDNCVAVISDNGEFLSLWLKPQVLPKL